MPDQKDKFAEGFPSQTLLHVSVVSINKMQQLPLCRALYVTDAGHYPEASYHEVSRPQGCPNFILIFCLGGSGFITIGDKSEVVEEGQLILIPANTAHKYGSNNQNSWRLYWAHFNGTEAQGIYDYLSENGKLLTLYLPQPAPIIKAFETTIRWVQNAYTTNAFYALTGSCTNLFGLIAELRRSKTQQSRQAEERIRTSIITMEQTIRTPLTLEQLSEEAVMSIPHYCSLFRKQTGSTPMQIYTKLRIKTACQLLADTALSVTEVAGEVGYGDAYYFSRAFKKVTGMSPSLYKKNISYL